jgi:hypothetical protein
MSVITLLRLEDSRVSSTPGWLSPLVLAPINGYVPQKIDLGFPEIREVANPRTDAHGIIDSTAYVGARPVVLEVALAPELTELASTERSLGDTLRAWLAPAMRPYLVYQLDPSDPIRRLEVRNTGASYISSFVDDDYQIMGIGWKAPNGFAEDYEATEATTWSTTAPTTETGRTYDLTFDRGYPATEEIEPNSVTVSGNVAVDAVIRLYGPCVSPAISNETTGAVLDFSGNGGLTLNAGEYLEVDVRNRTAYLNGDTSQSRYSYLNFSTSSRLPEFRLEPGTNTLRYTPASTTGTPQAVITFRNAWI